MFYCFRSFEDDIVRMHTDSIYLKQANNLIKTGDTIGHLKIEYEGKVDIKGLNTLGKPNLLLERISMNTLNKS
jgi:hypothetical protein